MSERTSLTAKLQLALVESNERLKARKRTDVFKKTGAAEGHQIVPSSLSKGSGIPGQQAILDYFARVLNEESLEEEWKQYTHSDMLAYQVMHDELSGLIDGARFPLSPQFSSSRSTDDALRTDALPAPPLEVISEMILACANAVLGGEISVASMLLISIRASATPFGCALQRLSHYFAEALAARISGRDSQVTFERKEPTSTFDSLRAYEYITAKCPYYALDSLFLNSVLLETFAGAQRVHIVDYGIANGYQWSSLMQALASRNGGPPQLLRITGIEYPQPNPSHDRRIKDTGRRLARFAVGLGIPFEYKAIATSKWEEVTVSSLNLREDEVLAVASLLRLRHLLGESRGAVLRNIRRMNPKVCVLAFVNWDGNQPLLGRLAEAIPFYSSYFDISECLMPRDNMHRLNMETLFFGKEIFNVTACEGLQWKERPEVYLRWHQRLVSAGFGLVPLKGTVMMSARNLMPSYKYDEHWGIWQHHGWMLMAWKGLIQHTVSAWKPV